ncbi:MAG: apolipoprotein N-acyltransferase [Burkholderiales bacterium]|nr:apolipoprotein N-acyltransferase [Burkholderiales bacterium]
MTGQAPRRTGLVLACAAGVAGVAGFAPAGLAPLAILALAALFHLASRATPGGAFRLGFAWGLGHFAVGVSWVYVSLHDFGMMPAPLAALATALFCAYLALFPAAAMWAMQRLGGGAGVRLLAAGPGAWTLAEWVRLWLFTGFPWLTLGYSQIDTPLAGFAPVAGVFAASLAASVVAGALAALPALRGRARAAAVAAALAVAAAGAALGRIEWTAPSGPPVTVALVQGNIPQDLKFDPARYRVTLETYLRLVGGTQARLIVLPETAVPRFLDLVEPGFVEALAAHARTAGGDLLLGAPVRAGERYYNAIVSLGSAPGQAYAKSHLVPFGEFVPPGFGWIVAVLRIPLSDFARGSAGQRPLAVAGERVAPNVCYEDAFGEEIIRMLPEATLLVNASNVAWFGDSLAPAQHLEISRMRALETGRFLLRATNTGVTAIVDDRGRVAARLPAFTEGVLAGEAQGRTGATPFVRFGNAPAVALASLLLASAAIAARRVRRPPTL